jgi:hypothetical protein
MPTRPYGAVIVDYDLDGDNDVIIGSSDPGFQDPDSIVIMVNDGWGTFTIQGFEANSGINIFCEDLTNDGYPDIISRDADSIFFHENDQNGGLGNTYTICDTYGNRMVSDVVDMDTNGLNDIIYFHNQYDYGVGIVYNQGQYQFSDSYFYPNESDGWIRPQLGDVNMDSIPDILINSNVKESGVYTLINNITSFEKRMVIQEAWTDGLIFDMNLNDTNDIFAFKNTSTVNSQSKSLLFQNKVSSYDFVDTAWFTGGGDLGCSVDFNLDGYHDLALFINSWISDPSEDSVFVYKNDKNWGFRLFHKHYIGPWFNPVLVSGDLNGDNYPEIVTLGYYNPTIDHIQILWNDGTGHFIDTNSVYVQQEEIELVNQINIYPNPTKSVINIDLPFGFVHNTTLIEIVNIHGSTELETTTESTSIEIDLLNFDSGIHIVKIHSGQTMYVKKIIKH